MAATVAADVRDETCTILSGYRKIDFVAMDTSFGLRSYPAGYTCTRSF